MSIDSESVAKPFLDKLEHAFYSLPSSIPTSGSISEEDTLLGKDLVNHSDNLEEEYKFFDKSLRTIFGNPTSEKGLSFPERGRRLNNILEDFQVMIDTIETSKGCHPSYLHGVINWCTHLIVAAKALHDCPEKTKVTVIAAVPPPSHQTATVPLPIQAFPIPKENASTPKKVPKPTLHKQSALGFDTIISKIRRAQKVDIEDTPKASTSSSMATMKVGRLNFKVLTRKEAIAQSARDTAAARKVSSAFRRQEKKKKADAALRKSADANARQKKCRKKQYMAQIANGSRDASGKPVKKTINAMVSQTQML